MSDACHIYVKSNLKLLAGIHLAISGCLMLNAILLKHHNQLAVVVKVCSIYMEFVIMHFRS